MKQCAIILLFFLTLLPCAMAQQLSKEDAEREKRFQEAAAKATADSAKQFGWHHALTTGANLTQVSFKDWVQGGENALAYALFLNGASSLDREQWNWSNSYHFAFGQTRLSTQGIRKTDDEIYFETLLIYKLGVTINPYASATLRSQFAKGFKYDDAGNETPVSKFFDPAYLTQSVGVAYQPIPQVKTRLGIAVREILTSKFNGYADDPATSEIEKTRVDGGLESVTDCGLTLADNLTLTTRLELFAPLKTMDEIAVRWDNALVARVNKIVTTSLGVQLVNDVTVSRRTQIKQVLALGVSITIL